MDTTPTPITDPVELRHAALAAIEADPTSWDQGTWRCDTGMCFAGHVAVLAGGTFPYPANDRTPTDVATDDGVARVERRSIVTAPDGTTHLIDEYAAKALALSPGVAGALFAGWNTFGDIEAMVADLDEGNPIFPSSDDDYDDDDDNF